MSLPFVISLLAGNAINPAIDVGQIEGAFVQGIGYVTCEDVEYSTDSNSGRGKGVLLSDNTRDYKIPSTTEIPQHLSVTMLPSSGRHWDKSGVHSSKTTGEPPIVLANTVFFAIRDAIRYYRRATNRQDEFHLDCPASTFSILNAINS
jgi:xanthine dehydrogenase/oxidase